MLMTYQGKHPLIGRNVYIAPTAVIIGDVTIGDDTSIWFNAVLRGDMEPLTIGARTSIQDNCTLHTDHGSPLRIGDGVTVGHNCVIHGCTVEDAVLVGMNSVVLNDALIGTGSILAAGCVIRQNQQVAPGSLMAGIPAKMKRRLSEKDQALIHRSIQEYQVLRQAYLLP
jgi:carbonic anhydrase/acetyltransferase-like protein (isoleucine patch superfamily)